MSNRITIAQMEQMPIREIARLPVEQLSLLVEDVAEQKQQVKLWDWLNGALALRYSEQSKAARTEAGKDSGTVRLSDGPFEVVANLPKKPKWSAPKLREAVATVKGWGEDPEEYVDVEYKVPEAKYKAWPSAIRDVFAPARTLETGKETFKFQPKKAEVA
jgi:hypothetical protein